MLTVPKVIASGESVTIPAGRVAILPDVQVDGTLNVLGDIFIPSGTANSKVVQKVTSTDNAIVRFDGTTGDVQNSGVIIDDSNNVGMNNSIGNTFTAYGIGGVNKGYVGDGNWLFGGGSTNDFGIRAANNLVFGIGATERMRIDSIGNVGIGTSSPVQKLDVNGIIRAGNATSTDGNVVLTSNYYGTQNPNILGTQYSSAAWELCFGVKPKPGSMGNYVSSVDNSAWSRGVLTVDNGLSFKSASATTTAIDTDVTMTERFKIGSNGNLLIGTTTGNGVDKLQVNGDITVNGTYKNTIPSVPNGRRQVQQFSIPSISGKVTGVKIYLDKTNIQDASYRLRVSCFQYSGGVSETVVNGFVYSTTTGWAQAGANLISGGITPTWGMEVINGATVPFVKVPCGSTGSYGVIEVETTVGGGTGTFGSNLAICVGY